ncbi:pyrimidine-nucleoside phosphorylase [Desmospora profundinema]|uniref:Pyrimidine-nucleoside phosphorylase n=1 Tax=Desmospora profundinema TaxID=1571184 RepID=A0ABU1IL95_9BACL|nr:pyrimidine-nucleoside phosphorylase [Desmospora profundinema]MDR6224575.1 pyrimidine-nucleoside phosphorylase [Desmospora profundinema]
MRTSDIIRKKREGDSLSPDEIRHLIQGYAKGEIPDYQLSAWAMAVFFQGMDERETADLTMEMVRSGDVVDLSAIQGVKVDKHSTGGVGDTTTLVLGPMVAAVGVPVAKLSGRGLGHTGGTIDKLESFPGFSTSLSTTAFVRQVNDLGIAVMGQTAALTPADKQLYALRDVTATVDSIPLIASSIMSKKIAAGADAIVLDVKTGGGAFMKAEERARELAEAMVRIGTHVNRRTVAVISDMDQPLGRAVGNALEVREAIDTLRGEGPADLTELCLELGAHMVVLGGRADTPEEAKQRLKACLADGSALEMFRRFVQAQGGDARAIDHPELLPQADHVVEVTADRSGTVSALESETIGLCAMKLGAGRETKESDIDYGVGVVLEKKVGDPVREGDVLAVLHVRKGGPVDEVTEKLRFAIRIENHAVSAPVLIKGVVTP